MKKNRASSIDASWLTRPEGRVFNNLTIADTAAGRAELALITGEKFMATAAKAGGKTVFADAKNQHYALHETTVSEKHPGLGKRDLVAELIQAAKKRGLRFVAYVPVDCDMRAWREHPEWRPRRADGSSLVDRVGFPRLCENSPFKDFMAAYCAELAANYEIAGFWFDGLGLASAPEFCYCDSCARGFQDLHGQPPPQEGAPAQSWALWREYRAAGLRGTMKSLREAIHRVKPGLPLITGIGSGNWQNTSTDFLEYSDMAEHENAWSWAPASMQILRAVHGKTPEYYIPTFQYGPSYPLTLPLEELRAKAFTAIANGSVPTFTMKGRPELLRTVNRELAARSAYCVGAEELPYCGIVFSERSMHACDPAPFAEPSYFTTYGVLRALFEEKIPEQYVSDRQLSGDLSRFAVIVLPNIGYLPEETAEKLRQYVAAGGGLVAMHRTSLMDGKGAPMANFLLADLFGVDFAGELPETTELPPWFGDLRDGTEYPNSQKMKFLATARHPIVDELIRTAHSIEVTPEFLRGTPADCRLPFMAPMLKVSPRPGTDLAMWEGAQEPGKKWPLVTTRRFGKGRVVYLAADLGRAYVDHHTFPYQRRILTNAVRFAARRRAPVSVEAPLHVQVTAFTQGERQIVHLLNDAHPHGLPPLTKQTWNGYYTNFSRVHEETIPLYGVKVTLEGKFRSVRYVPGEAKLPMTYAAGKTTVTLPRLDLHGMVVAEKASLPTRRSIK